MLNSFLAESLRVSEPRGSVRLIVEVADVGVVPSALDELSSIPNVRVVSQAFNFLTVQTSVDQLHRLERVGARVHYDMPRGVAAAPYIVDPVYGKYSLSAVTVPFTREESLLRQAANLPSSILAVPFTAASSIGLQTPHVAEKQVQIIPTGEARKWLGAPDDGKIQNARVAVLDTGLSPHPQLSPLHVQPVLLTALVEPPVDVMGHGQWCTTGGFGGRVHTRFGECRGVAQATGRTLVHVKILNSLGFGRISWTLRGIQSAVKLGAKIISLSLGGPLQGSVDEEPECQVIQSLKDSVIFVVAAGNSGSDSWTVDSPGVSPYALTVGAHTIGKFGISSFSSRGPSGDWYKGHQTELLRDQLRYGEDFIKPDCIAPGGGTYNTDNGTVTEVLYSGCVGWMNGTWDKNALDLYEGMAGTSMSTPQVAGLVALAYERGLVHTAQDVKIKLARSASGGKSIDAGYGRIQWQRLLR